MSEATGHESADAPETTLDDIQETLRHEFKAVGGRLDRLLKSSKSIEAGLADADELKDRLSRLKSYIREKQVLEVMESLNAHPNWSVAFAAKRLHSSVPHGFPTPEALTTACYRVNVQKFRSGPE